MSPYHFMLRFVTAVLLLLGAHAGQAASITNVAAVNVTPGSFTILCRSSFPVSIAIFSDANGSTNLSGQLGIESYPLHTGNPDVPSGYSRRQSQAQLRQRTQALGFSLIRVTGCQPSTTYYYQLSSSQPSVYPASGALPSVTTEQENAFVVDDQQLILDIPGLDNMGRVVTLTHTNASYPISAVIGDGVGTNQVFFNLNDLFHLATHRNILPTDPQTFDVNVLGPSGADVHAQFTVAFSPNFRSGQANVSSIGSEFFVLGIGSAVVQTGKGTNVPVRINSSSGLASVDVTLQVAPGHLSGLNLGSLAPEIDPVSVKVTIQSASNVVLHLPARAGQLISGNTEVARLAFNATAGQRSSFLPLTVKDVAAARPGNTLMTNLTLSSGRVVIVGSESLLEAQSAANGSRTMTLYANPNLAYALEYTTNMGPGAVWKRLPPMGVTSLVTPVSGLDGPVSPIFYRAVEYNADPPYLQAIRNQDGTRSLTLFGKPGSGYVLESSGAVGPQATWSVVNYIPLTLPFTNFVASGDGTVFYRAGEMVSSSPVINLVRNPDGSADLTLFGRPGYAYLLQTAPSGSPDERTTLQRVLLDSPFTSLHLTNINTRLVTALEYAPDPSVLELSPNGDGTAVLRLFGKPGSSYRLESTPIFGTGAEWQPLFRIPMETSYTNLQSVSLAQSPAFFRAVEFAADVPVIEALTNPDRSRRLLVYGRKSGSYTVEYTTSISNPVWRPMVTNVFSQSFNYINVTNAGDAVFYRVRGN